MCVVCILVRFKGGPVRGTHMFPKLVSVQLIHHWADFEREWASMSKTMVLLL